MCDVFVSPMGAISCFTNLKIAETGKQHLSSDQNPMTFHYTGWLIGILMMAYCSLKKYAGSISSPIEPN